MDEVIKSEKKGRERVGKTFLDVTFIVYYISDR